MFKKIIPVMAMLMGMGVVSANAQEALYSDIDTYINHYPISAYAVDGKMAVVAEDLRDYGFDVEWDGAARALHISRNEAVTQLTRKDIYDPSYPSGTKFSDIYASDIKVDYNGTPIASYALNGYTLIPINDFAVLAGSEQWLGDVRAYKVWVDGLSMCEYQPLTQRCRNLWYQTYYSQEMPKIDIWEDMNSDGQYENVVLEREGFSGGQKITNLIMGNSKIEDLLGIADDKIGAVYLVDLVPNDHMKELAIFYEWEGMIDYLRIFRYDGMNIIPMKFNRYNVYANCVEEVENHYLSNGQTYTFELHDDGSFTIEEETTSYGSWNVYKTYKIGWDGNFVQIPQDTYKVVETPWWTEQGYYYVKKTYTGQGFHLYKGEWIKPLLDDGENNILLQKKDGKQGWLRVGRVYKLYDVSMLFYVE